MIFNSLRYTTENWEMSVVLFCNTYYAKRKHGVPIWSITNDALDEDCLEELFQEHVKTYKHDNH